MSRKKVNDIPSAGLGKSIDEIQVGGQASFAKTIAEADVYNFAGVTGDLNPIHINQPYAEATFFKGRIAHGLLSSSLISNVLGTKLPGPGTIYKRQEFKFLKPVYIGDTIEARVEVLEIDVVKKTVKLSTQCFNQNGDMVVDGFATVLPPTKSEKERVGGV